MKPPEVAQYLRESAAADSAVAQRLADVVVACVPDRLLTRVAVGLLHRAVVGSVDGEGMECLDVAAAQELLDAVRAEPPPQGGGAERAVYAMAAWLMEARLRGGQ